MAVTDPNTILADSGLVNALYGEAGTKAVSDANAAALNLTSQGDAAEASQYGLAGAISNNNAAIATVSGQIAEFQNTRNLMKTMGAQRAGIAGAGFAQSGTAIDLARSSLQQGLLQNQVIGTNANLQASGYFQQAAASAAEGNAASAASAAAAANAQGATNVSNLTTAQMGVTGKFLQSMPGAVDALNGVLNPPSNAPQSFGFGSGVTYTPSWAQHSLSNPLGNSQGVNLPGIGPLGVQPDASQPTAPVVNSAGPMSLFAGKV